AIGNALVTGTYGGDSSHGESTSAAATITVNPRTTSTALNCSSPVVVNQASSCTATVSDTSPGTSITPTGRVNFTETGAAGSFSSATSCAIAAVSMGVAGCSVSYTPGATGNHLITASYTGDSIHLGGSSFSTITVGQRSTGTTVSCAPNGLGVDEACTATVTDNSP